MTSVYQQMLDLLRPSKVLDFYVNDIENYDTLTAFNFNLITDAGTFTVENIRFSDFIGQLIDVFRPGFGEILKEKLINTLEMAIQQDDDVNIKHQ